MEKLAAFFLTRLVSEKLIKDVIVILARKIVSKTKTKTDDEILDRIILAFED